MLGHFLNVATTFNCFLVMVLMWYHGNIYICETHTILAIEIPLTAFTFGFAVFWMVYRARQFRAWERLFK